MKNWIMALGALAMVSSGCNPIVLDPLQSQPPPVSPTSTYGTTLLVVRGGDAVWNDNFTLATSNGAPWTDPDSLVLFFSNYSQDCADPVLPVPASCGNLWSRWQTVIVIPPELARPGLIDLQDVRINHYATISFSDGSDGTLCGGGGSGGPLLSGTLEIISDGSTSLSVKLSDGVKPIGNDLIIDGEYTGQLCSALPPVPVPAPALAIRGADLPANPDTTAAPPDPDSLVVFLGTLPATCQDPWTAVDCSTASRLSFTLPLALQTPGTYDLSDPALAATYTLRDPSSPTSCNPPAGPFSRGTIEVLSSDAGGLTFKVYQSSSGWTQGVLYQFDGLYSASICP